MISNIPSEVREQRRRKKVIIGGKIGKVISKLTRPWDTKMGGEEKREEVEKKIRKVIFLHYN